MSGERLRPFFTFFGGKWRAAPHYPAPKYDTIVEPFAGSAGYSGCYPERKVILVERDPKIAATWRYLIAVSSAEILALPDIANDQTVDDLGVGEDARRLIGWWCNHGMQSPAKRPSAWMRSGKYTSFWGDRVRRRLAAQVERIRHWRIIEGDYSEAPDIEATWFVDPPYQKAGKVYRHGSPKLDFVALGEFCRYLRGQSIVCENVGADWLPFEEFRPIRGGMRVGGSKWSAEAIWLGPENDDAIAEAA